MCVFRGFIGEGTEKKENALWRCAILALLWCVWLKQNNRIFEAKEEVVEPIWETIRRFASLWLRVLSMGC
ncbi:hypothetical protein GBA52_004017 [Prunus armeniaca]|nr:hypothetical protein GBA52_004017 [Prunus armeniaca]